MKKHDESNFNIWMIAGIVVTIFALVIPGIAALYVSGKFEEDKQLEALGIIGDYLAGTTFLLALASIFFVISSIAIQKNELMLSRKELTESVDEQRKSNETMKLQQFETSFYNLLNHLIYSKDDKAINKLVEDTKNESLSLGYGIITDYLSDKNDDYKDYIKDVVTTFKQTKYKAISEKLIKGSEATNSIEDLKSYLGKAGNWINMDLNLNSLREIAFSDIPDNDYTLYLRSNFENICERRATIFYRDFNESLNQPLESFLDMLVVLFEHISKIDKDSRSFYFKVLLGQLSNKDKYTLRFLVQYRLHPVLKNYTIMYPELNLKPEYIYLRIL